MDNEILIIASRLLSYPDDQAETDYDIIKDAINDLGAVSRPLHNAVDSIHFLPLEERKQTYVATFDLKKKHALYLSAHEFGDSPKRGAALIRLQKIVNEAGFEREDGELADFIPMLMELVAVAEPNPDIERLKLRLGFAFHEIQTHMPESNPYRGVIDVLMEYVFETPTKEQMEAAKRDREEADLEELPYPLLYQ